MKVFDLSFNRDMRDNKQESVLPSDEMQSQESEEIHGPSQKHFRSVDTCQGFEEKAL